MNFVRTCLTATACLLLASPALAQQRFVPFADATEITDIRTGLVWRRCSEGQSWSGSSCAGTASRYTHEQALAWAQSQAGWRLPNVKELASIVTHGNRPLFDLAAFPGTVFDWYWTSSAFAGDSGNAWNVHFGYGYVSYGGRSNSKYVRLVR